MKESKVYLVGGAVRDQLLGKESADLDYVVVGSNPEEMLKLGFEQVGADFPVFLHPETKDEYALARTERKTEAGYNGFSCEWNGVTLKEDMSRRDLTVNAMAMDSDGNIIDYFGGKEDLKNKTLRHVSDAFAEDPLRILRIARFLAKMPDFTIAKETKTMIIKMVEDGAIDELKPDRIWKEFHRALEAKDPRKFIEALDEFGALKIILPILSEMKGVPQRKDYHSEGDVYIHTLMVLDEAVALTENADDETKLFVRMGALLHDVGKTKTPHHLLYNEDGSMRGSHSGHDNIKVVEPIIKDIAEKMKFPSKLTRFTLDVARFHQRIHGCKDFSSKSFYKLFDKINVKNKSDDRGENYYIDILLTTCLADARGRLIINENNEVVPAKRTYKQADIFKEKYALYSFGLKKFGEFFKDVVSNGINPKTINAAQLKVTFATQAISGKTDFPIENYLNREQKNILKAKKNAKLNKKNRPT